MKRFIQFLAVGIFLIFCSTVWADIPNQINFQGILDSAGNPMANKTVSVEFKIYNAQVGGTAYWSETQSVTTNAGGVFNVILGSSNPIPDTVFDDTVRYLGIKVGTDAEMTPRQQLVSNAYGYRVATVDGASGGTIFGNTSIQSDLYVNGNVGIGTTETPAQLTVNSGASASALELQSTSAGGNVEVVFENKRPGGATADVGKLYSLNTADNFDGGQLRIAMLGGLGFYSDVATFTGTGRVGIGTTSPTSELHVKASGASSGNLRLESGQGTTFDLDVLDLAQINLGATSNVPLNLMTNATARMTIDNNGEVGIGTTSPTEKLSVAGGNVGVSGGSVLLESGRGIFWPNNCITGSGPNLEIQSAGGIVARTGGACSGSLRMFIDGANGNVGIGTASPSEKLHVVGNICATGTIGACSDLRYKTNLKTVSNALEKVLNLKGIYFNWKKDQYPDLNFEEDRQIGFVAQELNEILPEVVSQGTDGFYSIDYGKLTPLLVEAIKEQQQTIQSLEDKLEKLEKKFSRFTSQTSGSEKIGYREEE